MRKAVFFDRDGVLNKPLICHGQPHSPENLEEFEITAEAPEALRSLKRAGFLLIVATNQPNVARGLQPQSMIEQMHERLRTKLPLDDIRVCYHDDHHQCYCRKPRPGLLHEAAEDWGISLNQSYMIGDRWKDVEAGRRAGCRTVLLRYPYNASDARTADHWAATLLEAAVWILDAKSKLEVPRPQTSRFV
jgi:D-glycero-D-manno-heptose 1,7-bisphosphate phosphatase